MKDMTVGYLRRALEGFPDDWELIFGCKELEFYRTKKRGEKLVQIEFNQSVYADENGKVIVENY